MSSNAINPAQAGRGVFNNQQFRKAIYNNLNKLQTDSIREWTPDTQTGVYFLNGASSTQGLETDTVGAPVVVNGSTPPNAGDVLVASSATAAAWDVAPLAPLDASYVVWPPGNTAPDLTLTNRLVLTAGDFLTVNVGGANVQLDVNPSGVVPAGPVALPTIDVDIKGRITNLVDSQTPDTTWTPVAGLNVDTVDTPICSYSVYFNEAEVHFDLVFTSNNVAAGPATTLFNFTGLPISHSAGPPSSTVNSALLLDPTTSEILNRGALIVNNADPNGVAYTAGINLPGAVQYRLVGSITFPSS